MLYHPKIQKKKIPNVLTQRGTKIRKTAGAIGYITLKYKKIPNVLTQRGTKIGYITLK